ncbi:auxin-responsive family protein [Populus alba x Populus x berolinensis]|nr:auxin-responsive family protein [Populus alba x Populus x berolinensis]
MQGGFLGGGSGGSVCMSTVSMEDNVLMSSEDSSSPDEGELELGLGLSLGGASGFKDFGQRSSQQYARILIAKDLPSKVSSSSSCSSTTSSSSSTLSRANATAGTKRAADSVSATNGAASSQVVGWPPIRSHRMHIMVNQAKSQATEEFNSMNKRKNAVEEKVGNKNINIGNTKTRTSLFVKVNMDGTLIGRKVDLNAHGCYETLAQALENMFLRTTTTLNMARLSTPEHKIMIDAKRHSQLLGGSSEFVLTYEDKDGDWMLVGDVPWGMFISSVKRLRIMRMSEATGLGK